jgi:putative transposase
VFPFTTVQTCIIHLLRNSLTFVSWRDRKHIMPDLPGGTGRDGGRKLDNFEAEWGKHYPAIGQAWRRAWEYVVPFFAFPPAIRKMIYATNAVESLHRSWRKIIKTRGSFPADEAAMTLLFLAIRNAGLHWRRPVEWTAAVGQFAILFGIILCPQRAEGSYPAPWCRHGDGIALAGGWAGSIRRPRRAA